VSSIARIATGVAAVVAVAGLVAAVAPRPAETTTVADAPGCPRSGSMPAPAAIAVTREAILCLLNRERAAHGLPRLWMNGTLEAASQRHSDDMVLRRFFDHDTPEGVPPEQRMIAAGYPRERVWVGENLWWGTGYEGTPVRAVNGWMHSHGHRENILRPQFTEVGVGVAYGAPKDTHGRRAITYTTDFGGPDFR
jgi:uncharacterized protein YkwD